MYTKNNIINTIGYGRYSAIDNNHITYPDLYIDGKRIKVSELGILYTELENEFLALMQEVIISNNLIRLRDKIRQIIKEELKSILEENK